MINALKRLWPAILLILAASGLLLFSDMKNRKASASGGGKKSIALMQSASTPLQDMHVKGIKDSLRAHGFLSGDESNLHQFNSQGDFTTATTVAREMVGGNFDILITSSTVGLQVVAKANQNSRKNHVFGAVTYPQGAGVGITGTKPGEHPPYLTGIGTFQPVERAFEIVRELKPSIKKVGVVWNPGEKCSEECLKIARKICPGLDIELLEATAANPSEVSESLRSLLAKKVEAVWVGGDTVAISSIPMMIHQGKQYGVPVFTNDPTDAAKGALFGVGADYYTVGRYTGDMASEVLGGRAPGSFAITNVVPEMLEINHDVLASLGTDWKLTESLRKLEDNKEKPAASLKPEKDKVYTIGLFYFAPMPIFEIAIDSFRKEMARHGFVEGRNLEILLRHPSGDMSMLSQVVKGLVKEEPDVLVAFSTPCLMNAIAHGKDCKIVFGIVSAPFQAGVGESFMKHLPNVTGVVEDLPTEESFILAKQFFPRVKRVGVMYNPSEANVIKELADIKRIFAKLDLELVSVTAANANEAAQNINALIPKGIDMYFAMADNTVASSLPTVVKVCSAEKIPLLAVDSSLMGSGAFLSCASGPGPDGRSVARMVIRVLRGESIRDMPIIKSEEQELTMDLNVLRRKFNLTVPDDLLMRCDRFFNAGAARGGPAQICMITLMSNIALEEAEEGFVEGLAQLGFREGSDYKIKRFNAQGDMSQVPQLLESALAMKPDLIATVTTPVMIAAAKKVKDVPVIFTVASDPEKVGVCKKGSPSNLSGVYDDPPVDKLVEMAIRHVPGLKKIGTLYDPSQMNSMISVEKLRKVAAARDLELLEASVSNVSEFPVVVQSLSQRGAQALIVSADNLVVTGFPAVAKSAAADAIPVFATEPELVKLGATAAIGDDYFKWGRSSGIIAARVLAGVPVDKIPMRPTGESVVAEARAKPFSASYKKEPADIRIVMFNHTTFTEDSRNGLVEGLKRAGLREDVDFKLQEYNANGDIATLSGIMNTIAADKADLLLAVTTPVLQASVRFMPKDIPVVFTAVGDAVAAGVCKSDTDHLPNLTGVTTRSPFEGMARLLHETMPDLKRVGTLYTPSEINSEVYLEFLKKALAPYNIEVVAVPVTSGSEIPLAADTLCNKDIQAVCQILDNTTRPGFLQLARKASDTNLPLFVFQSSQMKGGAVFSISRDFFHAGLEAAAKAVQVLNGSSPASIPISNTQTEELFLNEKEARRYNLAIPPELLKKAKLYKEEK